MLWYFFFFSSRRRHTRCSRDWSSDVCSSDLARRGEGTGRRELERSAATSEAKSPFSLVLSGLEVVQLPGGDARPRSEEHTSELQSRLHLVCRLLLEKKKKKKKKIAEDNTKTQ